MVAPHRPTRDARLDQLARSDGPKPPPYLPAVLRTVTPMTSRTAIGSADAVYFSNPKEESHMAEPVKFGNKPKKPRKTAGSDNFFWDVMSKTERKWASQQARKAKRKAAGGGS